MAGNDYIKFLGTAGARFVVSKQLRYSAGIWCFLKGVNILIDPGPGTLLRCFMCQPKLDPEKLEAIVLTHRHLDHSTDINVLTEAMTHGRMQRRGRIYAPSDAINLPEPAIYRYLHGAVERVVTFSEKEVYSLKELSFSTPVQHIHGVETYGLKFFLDYGSLAFITDTLYFPELAEHYAADLLVINAVLRDPIESNRIFHLNVVDVKKLLKKIKPRAAVLTHFGLTMLKSRPWKIAEEISHETGVKVIAAHDGMSISPEELVKC